MSHQHDPGEPEEIEYALKEFSGPAYVAHQLLGELLACWRCLPAGERSVEAAVDSARAAIDRGMAWWLSLPSYGTEPIAMALHDGMDARSLEPTAESTINREQAEETYRRMSEFNRDSAIRQAIFTCWCLLPASRRNASEVVRITREIFGRTVAAFREDARTFA
ncbi:MAG: hypothetical protein ACHRHE_12470 [Tepidisphaerales bacterium]